MPWFFLAELGWDLSDCGWDLAGWLERLAINAKVTTVLCSNPSSSDAVKYEGRQMKQCWITYTKDKNQCWITYIKRKKSKNPPFWMFSTVFLPCCLIIKYKVFCLILWHSLSVLDPAVMSPKILTGTISYRPEDTFRKPPMTVNICAFFLA